MAQKASEIQKQRIQEIEMKADELVKKSEIMFVSSVNEKGYPRTCGVRSKGRQSTLKQIQNQAFVFNMREIR